MATPSTRRARPARIQLIDNWHDRWPLALALIDRLGHRACLQIDEDGWLSARQNLLIAFVGDKPAGLICFSVRPMLEGAARLTDESGRPLVEAVVDAVGVDPERGDQGLSMQLRQAAMSRALELNCRRFVDGDCR